MQLRGEGMLRLAERGEDAAQQLLEPRSSIKGKRRVRAIRKHKYAAILRTLQGYMCEVLLPY